MTIWFVISNMVGRFIWSWVQSTLIRSFQTIMCYEKKLWFLCDRSFTNWCPVHQKKKILKFLHGSIEFFSITKLPEWKFVLVVLLYHCLVRATTNSRGCVFKIYLLMGRQLFDEEELKIKSTIQNILPSTASVCKSIQCM